MRLIKFNFMSWVFVCLILDWLIWFDFYCYLFGWLVSFETRHHVAQADFKLPKLRMPLNP